MARYEPKTAEPRQQARWAAADAFRTPTGETGRPKYYVLEMFPYPSGNIHMGHARNYVMGDVVARSKRAQGFDVLHPMGWDAFGLPAENAAIERGVHPGDWTWSNIAAMRQQLKLLGLSLDWSREFATCDPAYYGQQQRWFLRLLERGLVYRKEATVNWDPVDMTVLANEQVIDGRGWRSGAVVEKRKLTQWFLRITDYADELLEGLETLDRWPDKVRLMQENWIGKSRGLQFVFNVADEHHARFREAFEALWEKGGEDPRDAAADNAGYVSPVVEVYTTRPDTLFGASFVGIAPDHPLAEALAARDPKVAAFVAECRRGGTSEADIEAAEKLGWDTGIEVVHPFDPDWKLPVWIANFILMDYGTGAIFGCPAHDQRDLDFARKYGLPARPVVLPPGEDPSGFDVADEAYVGPGTIFNSDFMDGLEVEAAKAAAIGRVEAQGQGEGACATGAFRASATGAVRSRSSTAASAAPCPCPTTSCRSSCRPTSPSTSPATRCCAIRPGGM